MCSWKFAKFKENICAKIAFLLKLLASSQVFFKKLKAAGSLEACNFIEKETLTQVWTHVMIYAIWYHLYNFKILKNAQASACNFTKNNTRPWVLFTFFKLYKWYQILQSLSYEQMSPSVQHKWVAEYSN